MIEKGMGRTRLTRFAAITIPAAAATVGLGIAIVQGAVSADLASSTGFQLASTGATADSLQLGLEYTAAATNDASSTASNHAGAEVALTNSNLNDMCLAATTNLSVFGNVGLKVASTSPVALTGVTTLDAGSVAAAKAALPTTTIGRATSQESNLATANAGVQAPGGFAMDSTSGTPGSVALTGLNAQAYELTLTNGLNLNNLSIQPVVGTATC